MIDLSFEELLKNKLSLVDTKFDKREGSIIWDALAPNAWETYLLIQELKIMRKEMFASTASRAYLIEHCKERGIYPKPASFGVFKGTFNKMVPIGSRFSLGLINYTVIKHIDNFNFELEAEVFGNSPNGYFGELIPIDFIDGLAKAELTEILIPGEDEEDTEKLRERYLNSFDVIAFGGNIKDYEEKTKAIAGVGEVLVTPVWNGGGTVKLSIIDSEYKPATQTLIQKVKELIDPQEFEGLGYGIAPIGHVVTVDTPAYKNIYIYTEILKNEILTEEDKTNITNSIAEYFNGMIKTWTHTENQHVRIQKIEHAISNSVNFVDIKNTKINGSASNYVLNREELPNLVEVSYGIF